MLIQKYSLLTLKSVIFVTHLFFLYFYHKIIPFFMEFSTELKSCPVCSSITDCEIESLKESIDYRIKRYSKGDIIASQGDRCDSLYVLVKGKVKTEMISEGGSLLTIEEISAVKPMASAFLFAQENRFPVYVIALEECYVFTIFKQSVIKLFQNNESFLDSYLRFNSNKTHFLTNKIQILTCKTIKGKFASYVLDLLKRGKKGFENKPTVYMDMNQTDLAKYFGVTRPALARIMSDLQQDNIISYVRNSVTVLDVEALIRLKGF